METKQLELLMSYTVFHIGVYVSLIIAAIGAAALGQRTGIILKWAALCFLVAGLCGAIIGSNIPNYATFAGYDAAKIGFWNFQWASWRFWAFWEHLAFWLGILPIVVDFLIRGPNALKPFTINVG